MWYWAKKWYEDGLPLDKAGKAEAVACCVHTMPLISSFVELIITKMVFLKRDAKWSLFIGLIYIPVNYFGTIYEKSPVYAGISYLDWTNKWETFGIFFG